MHAPVAATATAAPMAATAPTLVPMRWGMCPLPP
jgi:hypothetical protein